MAEIVQVTQQDIDGLSTKLDQFATVLTERERTVLYGVFGMAGKSIEQVVAAAQGGAPAPGGGSRPLSRQFQDAFENGVGTKFRLQSPTEAEQVRVKGSVDGDWAKG